MVTNKKPTGRALSMPAGLLLGGVISVAITMICTAILAKLLDSEVMTWENIGYGILLILLLSSIIGSETACMKIKHQKLLVCLLSGVIYFGTLMATTALFFGGQYEAVGVTALVILGGCMTTALLEIQKGKGRSNRRGTNRRR